MFDDSAKNRFIGSLVGERALSAPDGREVGPGQGWEPVPGGHGVVFVTGAPEEPRERWTIDGAPVTVAELRAAADHFLAHGLGALAVLSWILPTFKATAVSWGVRSTDAVGDLAAELGRLWPDVQAAVHGATVRGAWAPGAVRTTAAGVQITAPAAWSSARYTALAARHGDVGIRIEVDARPRWLSTLRTAVTIDPRPLAVAHDVDHAKYGRLGTWSWQRQVGAVSAVGLVALLTPMSPADDE